MRKYNTAEETKMLNKNNQQKKLSKMDAANCHSSLALESSPSSFCARARISKFLDMISCLPRIAWAITLRSHDGSANMSSNLCVEYGVPRLRTSSSVFELMLMLEPRSDACGMGFKGIYRLSRIWFFWPNESVRDNKLSVIPFSIFDGFSLSFEGCFSSVPSSLSLGTLRKTFPMHCITIKWTHGFILWTEVLQKWYFKTTQVPRRAIPTFDRKKAKMDTRPRQ